MEKKSRLVRVIKRIARSLIVIGLIFSVAYIFYSFEHSITQTHLEEKKNQIIVILTALLTGGFLMVFIESQQMSSNVTERFNSLMKPFFHSFTNYLNFMSSFKTCLSFRDIDKSDNMKRLKTNIDEISKLAHISIMSGRDYRTNYFTAKQLDTICETINDIWYCIDKDFFGFEKIDFDNNVVQINRPTMLSYLEEISPTYKGKSLTKFLLGELSGDFYVNIYQPIQNIIPEYEYWQGKEKIFKKLAFLTVFITLVTMILMLFLNCIWVFDTLCVCCCILLLIELYNLIKIEDLSRKIMR